MLPRFVRTRLTSRLFQPPRLLGKGGFETRPYRGEAIAPPAQIGMADRASTNERGEFRRCQCWQTSAALFAAASLKLDHVAQVCAHARHFATLSATTFAGQGRV